jgi:hypothetical protein
MGPSNRLAEFKAIETSPPPLFGLQPLRWPPTRLANSPEEAFMRLFMLRGSHYSEPEFSWKFAVAPAGIGFMSGRGIGPQYEGDLFVGALRPTSRAAIFSISPDRKPKPDSSGQPRPSGPGCRQPGEIRHNRE